MALKNDLKTISDAIFGGINSIEQVYINPQDSAGLTSGRTYVILVPETLEPDTLSSWVWEISAKLHWWDIDDYLGFLDAIDPANSNSMPIIIGDVGGIITDTADISTEIEVELADDGRILASGYTAEFIFEWRGEN